MRPPPTAASDTVRGRGVSEPYRISQRAHLLKDGGALGRPTRFAPEVRERAVRLVEEQTKELPSQWAAIRSVAEKLGCRDETLRRWVRQAEQDTGKWPGLTTTERERLKDLERENRELRRANEILRKAAAFFAQAELDRRAT